MKRSGAYASEASRARWGWVVARRRGVPGERREVGLGAGRRAALGAETGLGERRWMPGERHGGGAGCGAGKTRWARRRG